VPVYRPRTAALDATGRATSLLRYALAKAAAEMLASYCCETPRPVRRCPCQAGHCR
jgi:hypothetical protein